MNHILEERKRIADNINKSYNTDSLEKGGPGSGRKLGTTLGGKDIYEGHKFSMYSYPGKWHTEKVTKVDNEGYHTTGHNNPIPHQEFHEKIDLGEKLKQDSKLKSKTGKLSYFRSH